MEEEKEELYGNPSVSNIISKTQKQIPQKLRCLST